MIKMQQPLLTLCEQIHKPFVQRLIALLVSGLIALLLGGALLLSGHGAFITHLPKQAARASGGWLSSGHSRPPCLSPLERRWLLLRLYPGSVDQMNTW